MVASEDKQMDLAASAEQSLLPFADVVSVRSATVGCRPGNPPVPQTNNAVGAASPRRLERCEQRYVSRRRDDRTELTLRRADACRVAAERILSRPRHGGQ